MEKKKKKIVMVEMTEEEKRKSFEEEKQKEKEFEEYIRKTKVPDSSEGVSKEIWDKMSEEEREKEYTNVLQEYAKLFEDELEEKIKESKWTSLSSDEQFEQYKDIIYIPYKGNPEPTDFFIDGKVTDSTCEDFLEYFSNQIEAEEIESQAKLEKTISATSKRSTNVPIRVSLHEEAIELGIDPEVLDDMSVQEAKNYLQMIKDNDEE